MTPVALRAAQVFHCSNDSDKASNFMIPGSPMRTVSSSSRRRDAGEDERATAMAGLGPRSLLARLRARAAAVYRNGQQLQLVLLLAMVMVYGPLLWVSWRLSPNQRLNLTYNSMLEHLLHGRFDVDPGTVGDEGYLRGENVYTYWGIFGALLRVPLLPFHRTDVDVTVWSCLLAVCAAGMAKVRALLVLRRHSLPSRQSDLAVGLMLGYILLGGSQIGYLSVSIYQEVILWSYAFTSVFVYLAIRGFVHDGFDRRSINLMAASAGFTLLTRVSTAVGLMLALALLLMVLAAQSTTTIKGWRRNALRCIQILFTKQQFYIPIGILATAIVLCGIVNYFRWGSPTTFVDYRFYLNNQTFPSKHAHGSFDPTRIPFGLMYYFLPVWVLHVGNGQLVFAPLQERFFARVETPPSSFLLTDLLSLSLIAFLAVSVWRRRVSFGPAVQWSSAVAIGLSVPCILMLAYISMAYRYRMEFYPFMDFLAFLGLYLLLKRTTTRSLSSRFFVWMRAATAISIVSSFMALSLYDLSLCQGRPHAYYHHAIQSLYQFIGN